MTDASEPLPPPTRQEVEDYMETVTRELSILAADNDLGDVAATLRLVSRSVRAT